MNVCCCRECVHCGVPGPGEVHHSLLPLPHLQGQALTSLKGRSHFVLHLVSFFFINLTTGHSKAKKSKERHILIRFCGRY